MSLPSLLLSFLLASFYGVAFYFIFGRGWVALAVYWLAALAGFAFGQTLSTLIDFSLLPIGAVNVVEASVFSLLALWLTRAWWRRRQA